jgi:hypothetical protein
MTNEKTARIENERLVALLGLAAGKPQPEDQCPPAERFSAFIDGRLSSSERKRIIAHLNACEQCYQEWLETALVLSDPPPKVASSQPRSWWQPLQALWRTRPWMIPLTAALAMSLAVIAVVIQKPSQETWQISQLAAMVRNHPGLDQALAALPQDLGTLSFAFSDTPQNPAKQAFTAGFRQAWSWFDGTDSSSRRALESSKPWLQRSSWQDYYDLGQWAFLTWLLAQTEGVSAEEWRVFERHCQNLITRFEQQPEEPTTERVLASLREIHPMLGALARQPDPTQQVRLGRRLRLIIQQFLS